jgi:hypothetical protein
MIEIFTDLPPPRGGGDLKRKWPFDVLKVGESIKVAAADERRALQAARGYKHRHPEWSYVAGRDPEGALRIWRRA